MTEYKTTVFDFPDRIPCKPAADSTNVGPYSIPKLMIPPEEISAHQSFWSCSSSQSGSTEAEDDSRVDRERHSDSFRSMEEYRPTTHHQEDFLNSNDYRRLQARPIHSTVNGVHYQHPPHCDNYSQINIGQNLQQIPFENSAIVPMQDRTTANYYTNRKLNSIESTRVVTQSNMWRNGPGESTNYLAQPSMRIPASAQMAHNQVFSSSNQVRHYNGGNALPLPPRSGDYNITQNPNHYKSPVSPLSSTYHNAASQGINTLNGMIYQVQFKCTFRHFILGVQQQSHTAIGVGEFVVVEADRGEDIGIVTDILPMKTFVERRIYMKASVEDDNVIGRIVRVASVAERQFLPEKFHDEDNILQFCRELSHSTYRLPMVIHDVEYQFDRHKLTVYYAADSRVDFREFVRDLFSAYKARIWMKKLNTQRPIKLENWANIALATGMQFSPDNK